MEEVWNRFEKRFLELWRENIVGDAYESSLSTDRASREELILEQRRYLHRLFHDSLGFAGVKMIRRVLGLAHVEELEAILDPDIRARCERKALRVGRLLVINAESFVRLVK